MHEQRAFTIILRWSEEQHASVGQVHELVGIEGSGSSYEEALASALEAMRAGAA
jgi:predicted RNase H-like HicB family nuclease